MKLHTAIILAAQAHGDQLDKSGEPYLLHPLRVMEAVRELGEDYMVVAALHDVIEDTDWALGIALNGKPQLSLPGWLASWPITGEQAAALDAISRRPHPEETYREYVERVAANPIARAVKIADVNDNLDPRRQAGLDTGERKGMTKRYQDTLARLAEDVVVGAATGERQIKEGPLRPEATPSGTPLASTGQPVDP